MAPKAAHKSQNILATKPLALSCSYSTHHFLLRLSPISINILPIIYIYRNLFMDVIRKPHFMNTPDPYCSSSFLSVLFTVHSTYHFNDILVAYLIWRCRMIHQERNNNGILGYWIGFWMLVGCWGISFLVSGMVEPLNLLKFRLILNGVAVLYFLSYYLFQCLQQYKLERKRREQIIVIFNGKECILS